MGTTNTVVATFADYDIPYGIAVDSASHTAFVSGAEIWKILAFCKDPICVSSTILQLGALVANGRGIRGAGLALPLLVAAISESVGYRAGACGAMRVFVSEVEHADGPLLTDVLATDWINQAEAIQVRQSATGVMAASDRQQERHADRRDIVRRSRFDRPTHGTGVRATPRIRCFGHDADDGSFVCSRRRRCLAPWQGCAASERGLHVRRGSEDRAAAGEARPPLRMPCRPSFPSAEDTCWNRFVSYCPDEGPATCTSKQGEHTVENKIDTCSSMGGQLASGAPSQNQHCVKGPAAVCDAGRPENGATCTGGTSCTWTSRMGSETCNCTSGHWNCGHVGI